MDKTTMTATHIALLAPVPLIHLRSAAEKRGRVAFATKDWELFRRLDGLRKEMTVDVYIYASHPKGEHDPCASWHAKYVCIEEDNNNAAPYRPASTVTDTYESEVFWIVEALRELPPEKRIAVADFTAYDTKKSYGRAFPPHRPLLVEHPL